MSIISLSYIILLSSNLVSIIVKGHYRKSMPFTILAIFYASALILELCTSILFISLPNNLFFYHIYIPVEFTLFSTFFSSLGIPRQIKKVIVGLIFPFIIINALLTGFIQGINENNSFAVLLESALLILYSLLYLRHINIMEINTRAEKNPFFWITMGILFYSIGAFFVEGFINVLMKIDEATARKYYKMSFIYKYIMCTFCLVGILMKNETKIN